MDRGVILAILPMKVDKTNGRGEKQKGRTFVRPVCYENFDAAPQFYALLHTRFTAFLHHKAMMRIGDFQPPTSHQLWGQEVPDLYS